MEVPAEDERAGPVPLNAAEVDESPDNLLRAFASGQGLRLRQLLEPHQPRVRPDPLGATSPVVNALKGAAEQFGQRTAGNLFRVELPAGQTIENLVPAVGGGFRGITRAADGTQIAGHARLLPATAGTAGALAAGPAIGLLALSAASQMLAQKQMNAKLDAIHNDVKELRDLQREKEAAVLPITEKMIKDVSHYLLDRVTLPKALAADSTFGRFLEFHEIRRSRLAKWEEVADRFDRRADADGDVDGAELMAKLSKSDSSGMGFGREVEETYQAFALMARLSVIRRIEVAVSHPDADLRNVDSLVAADLDQIADDQARLTEVVGRLSGLPLTWGYLTTPAHEGT